MWEHKEFVHHRSCIKTKKRKEKYQSGSTENRPEGLPLSPATSAFFSQVLRPSEHRRQHGRQNGAVLVSDREIRQNWVIPIAIGHNRVVEAHNGFETHQQRWLFAFVLLRRRFHHACMTTRKKMLRLWKLYQGHVTGLIIIIIMPWHKGCVVIETCYVNYVHTRSREENQGKSCVMLCGTRKKQVFLNLALYRRFHGSGNVVLVLYN